MSNSTSTEKRRTLSGKKIPALTPPTSFQTAILNGLQQMAVYPGTVATNVKARRRAASKLARVSRRVNRGVR